MKRFFAALAALSLTLSMAACGNNSSAPSASSGADSSAPASSAADSSAPSEASSAPAAQGTGLYPGTPDADMITINLGSEPPDMSTLTTDTTGSFNVLRHTMVGLTALDENDAPVPAIAESWESAPNDAGVPNMKWTFHLSKDYTWNVSGAEYAQYVGKPVTAQDFIYAWTQVLTPATGAQYSYMGFIFKNGEKFFNGECGIEEVGFKAIDDYTLEIELENPLAYLLSQMAFATFCPVNQEIYEAVGEDKYNRDAASMFCNGPYIMTDWIHNDSLVLAKNESYPKAADIKTPKVKMLMITDSNTALNAFRAGELDMIGLSGEQAMILEAEGQPLSTYADGSVWYFQFHTILKGLDNAKIRKALTMANDTDVFIKNILQDQSVPAYYFSSSSLNGVNGFFVDRLPNEGISFGFDKDAAKALLDEGLAEAGMTLDEFNALGYSILTDDTDTALKNAQYFQEQWKQNLGVEIQIKQMTYKDRVAATHAKDYDISLFGWGPDYNDPMTFLDLWVTKGTNNDSEYSNPAYDELINQARAEADPATREGYFVECEKILNQDMPCGPIYTRMRFYVCSDKLTGMTRTTFQDINCNTASIAG
ncbi:MAG: peptide ABC transporter substrate-binding protein [Provencibacterium sp.]|jgi:oligopeptide transport system substrate-binding protein|nr:peptide ABC transporter substrate-binding protein [Provencibacterium sp.]